MQHRCVLNVCHLQRIIFVAMQREPAPSIVSSQRRNALILPPVPEAVQNVFLAETRVTRLSGNSRGSPRKSTHASRLHSRLASAFGLDCSDALDVVHKIDHPSSPRQRRRSTARLASRAGDHPLRNQAVTPFGL